MAALKLVGRNYTTPDLVAKVTGQAKYAEDFRVDGMLFARLLLSPMPHARVKKLNLSAARAMPGVKAIITADDIPAPAATVTDLGQTIQANMKGERALTSEPMYQGEPILAVAAVDELTAIEAIEKIEIDWEPLPFSVDPIDSLRPGRPTARLEGNVWVRPPAKPGTPPPPPEVQNLKWTEEELADARDGRLPMGKVPDQWTYGDLDAGFKNAALVLDETFVTPNTSHQTLESRTAMAYWQNGKLFLHCSTQSTVQTVASVARWLHMDPNDVVIISQYTGGGFGSKATGTHTSIIPALLAKKANAPVMMRISREEEHYIGGARPSLHGRMKVGFAKNGQITAIDMFVVCENGPYEPQGDTAQSGRIVSLLYQPQAKRWRGAPALTNTPPRPAQSQPGGLQGIMLMEPLLSKAARKLALDQVAIRRMNAPEGKAQFGPASPQGTRAHATSSFMKQALDRGRDLFKWDERKAASGKRQGARVRGVGVAMSTFVAGSVGFDGLFVIKPDGRLYIQSGIGNLGTESVSDVHRVSAEMVGVPWEKCELTWGNTGRNLPWSCVSGGSQTTHAHTRATHSFVAGFAEVEVDVETGKYQIVDYLAVADVGTVVHPNALGGQVLGRSMLGIGHAIGQKWVYDQHYGVPLAKRFHYNKPPTILDAPQKMAWEALDIPDPETPVGARGIGEPPVAAGCCAVLNALADALGDEIFRRAPVTPDEILTALETGRPTQDPLTAHV